MIGKKRVFTLLEITLVIIISGSILTTVYGIMTVLPKVKNFNDARQNLIQQTNDVMDRFAIMFQDYTIDYEEYFNRKMVWCDGTHKWATFEWAINASGYCSAFTAYGNENAKLQTSWEEKRHHAIACSSDAEDKRYSQLFRYENCKKAGDPGTDGGFSAYNWGKSSYGQYKQMFRDVKNDTDGQSIAEGKPIEVGDSDDRDEGQWPIAIGKPENIQELYLISHDGTRRLFLRKNLKTFKDFKGEISTGYTIQMLKLRGFDAGKAHNFDARNDVEVYDGQIDTWACDFGQHFSCWGAGIPNYSGYKLPSNQDDGWVDLFDDNLNIVNWNMQISPVKNPDYAWAEEDQQINPFVQITLTAELSKHLWANKLGGSTTGYQYTLQNLYDTKGFYLK